MFAQETSISRQFTHQWGLRMSAQEAALKEMANGKLRNLLAHNRSFYRTKVKVCDRLSARGAAAAGSGGDSGYQGNRSDGEVSDANFRSGPVLCLSASCSARRG